MDQEQTKNEDDDGNDDIVHERVSIDDEDPREHDKHEDDHAQEPQEGTSHCEVGLSLEGVCSAGKGDQSSANERLNHDAWLGCGVVDAAAREGVGFSDSEDTQQNEVDRTLSCD